MAWVKTITGWIPSWSSNGATISIPITSFPQMTAAEADITTGDIRKVLYAIVEACWLKWNGLAAIDRSVNMVLSKNSYVNPTNGITTHTYTFTFQNVTTAQDVADEV